MSLAEEARQHHNPLKHGMEATRMIGRLNHVAIAVPDLEAAATQYRNTLGAKVGAPQDEPDHGVTVVFIELPNTKAELLFPVFLRFSCFFINFPTTCTSKSLRVY